jgi:hypothetical protein
MSLNPARSPVCPRGSYDLGIFVYIFAIFRPNLQSAQKARKKNLKKAKKHKNLEAFSEIKKATIRVTH